MSQQPVCTTCPYCGTGCGILATPDNTGGLSIQGDPDHPANFGRLCSKGSALTETIDLEGRLLAPLINKCGATWDDALDLVADKFLSTIEKHGPDSVAFYVSGQLLTEDYYVANKLMKGYIGSANIDTNSRLCMASTVAGHKRAFGTDTVPGTYEDLELADLLIITGSNLAWCHPVLYQRIAAAKLERPSMKVVVVDPRRTATCDLADLYLPLNPGTDVALFNYLFCQTHAQGALDVEFVAKHTNGFTETLDAARASDVAITGLSKQQVNAFVRMWLTTEKTVTVFSQGINQSDHGTDKVNAIINCHLASGRIGKPGSGPFSVTGQPNAMGGREVGGLANTLACHLDLEDPTHRDTVQSFWRSPSAPSRQGLKAVDMFDAIGEGKIKALWVMCTNPAVSMPNATKVRSAIANCEFVVVSDMFATTDTARLADVVLPATGWGEKNGTVTNSDRTVSRQRSVFLPPGTARHDWNIICDVAQRMGFGAGFNFSNPAEIFREHAALSGLAANLGKDFDISGLADLSNQEYQNLKPVRWPVKEPNAVKDPRFFAKGHFFTNEGRANLVPIKNTGLASQNDALPLRLNTGRVRDQWHTMTRTGRATRLNQHYGEPFLEIHPEDATQLDVSDADLVEVQNENGTVILRALLTNRVARGSVFAPIHWSNEDASRAVVSDLVPAIVDPISGQPDSKAAHVSVTKFRAQWYGYAVGTSKLSASTKYWAKTKLTTGWQLELADVSQPESWVDYASKLFEADDARCTSLIDATRGRARLAFHRDGKLIGALFVDRTPVQVSRSFVSGMLGQDATHILAGQPGDEQLDPGSTVCACFNIGVNTILSNIEQQNLTSVEQIGNALSAGTNCGSCRPELAALLSNARREMAAE
ncbi:nitrate reductase [uncultured Shimia sp.]|uniref:nitrate reductase n=1 Tax=uncultured Shimia sp. TaxID=573152 RepID=UPI0026245A39|nr:nitrate reductase [uncultured Shimia sp.]